jgi:hypothetical protein
VPKKVNAYVPPVKLNDTLFDSVVIAEMTVMATDPVLITLITGVPVDAYPPDPVKTVPVPFNDIVFVPYANVPVNPVMVNA